MAWSWVEQCPTTTISRSTALCSTRTALMRVSAIRVVSREDGSEAQGWLNLQTAYDLRVAEKLNAKTIHKEIAPLAMAA